MLKALQVIINYPFQIELLAPIPKTILAFISIGGMLAYMTVFSFYMVIIHRTIAGEQISTVQELVQNGFQLGGAEGVINSINELKMVRYRRSRLSTR